MRRRVARLLGALVGLAGLYYVGRLVVQRRDEVGSLMGQLDPLLLLSALVLGLLGMTLIGIAWNLLLGALDRPLPRMLALRAYFVGQLGKYVPGGVWAIVGRGEWARREGIRGGSAYTSTLLSMGTAYLAASLLTLALLPTVGDVARRPLVLGVAALGVLGAAAAHPALLGRVAALTERLTKRDLGLRIPPYRAMARAVGLQVITWLLIGTGTWLVARGLGFSLPYAQVVVATAVGWVIGLLVLPVPGGIGIREGVFVAVLGASGDVAAVALASRLVAIAVDVVGAAITTVLIRLTDTTPERAS